MGLPGHRRTSTERKQRAYHARLEKRALSRCAQCGKARRPHRACTFCGTYKKTANV